MFHDALKPAVFLDEFQCWFWANTSDRFQVVASQKNAQVNELQRAFSINIKKRKWSNSTWLMFMSRPARAAFKSISLMGCFLASENVRWRNSMGALNVSVSISSEPAAYTYSKVITTKNNMKVEWSTFPPRASSAHCASASEGAYSDKLGRMY